MGQTSLDRRTVLRLDSSRLISCTDGRWCEALTRMGHQAFHLPAFAAREALLSGGEACAFVHEQDGHVLLLPLIVREVPQLGISDAHSPSGYAGPVASTADPRFWAAAVRGLQRVLAERGVVSCFIRTSPVLPAAHDVLRRAGTLVLHGETVSVDLHPAIDELVAGFRGSTRREIAEARRRGQTADVDDWDRWPAFVDAYRQTMSRVGATADHCYSERWFATLRGDLGETAHLVTVSAGGELLGGGVFLEGGGVVDYYLSGVRTSALRERPAKLMLEVACRWARARGAVELHLGGGAGRGPQDTLLAFKSGFSSRRFPVHTWRLVTDAAAYERALGPAAADDREGFFPAYRVPLASSAG